MWRPWPSRRAADGHTAGGRDAQIVPAGVLHRAGRVAHAADSIGDAHVAAFAPACSPRVSHDPHACGPLGVVPADQHHGVVTRVGGVGVEDSAGVGFEGGAGVDRHGDGPLLKDRPLDGVGTGDRDGRVQVGPRVDGVLMVGRATAWHARAAVGQGGFGDRTAVPASTPLPLVVVVGEPAAGAGPVVSVAAQQPLLGEVHVHAIMDADGTLECPHRAEGPACGTTALVADRWATGLGQPTECPREGLSAIGCGATAGRQGYPPHPVGRDDQAAQTLGRLIGCRGPSHRKGPALRTALFLQLGDFGIGHLGLGGQWQERREKARAEAMQRGHSFRPPLARSQGREVREAREMPPVVPSYWRTTVHRSRIWARLEQITKRCSGRLGCRPTSCSRPRPPVEAPAVTEKREVLWPLGGEPAGCNEPGCWRRCADAQRKRRATRRQRMART